MNWIATIDDFLIDRIFEPFCHWFQRLTGKTNFWWARVSLLLSWLLMTVAVLDRMLVKKDSFLAVFWVVLTGFLLFLAWICYEKDKDILGEVNSDFATMNEMRIKLVEFRIVTIVFSTILVAVLMIVIGTKLHILIASGQIIFWVLYIYFRSCTPLPPATSKVRKWLEKFSQKLVPANESAS